MVKHISLFISIIILYPLISACETDKSNGSVKKVTILDPIIGKWVEPDTISYPYEADFIISKDSTFTFTEGACMMASESQGTWIKDEKVYYFTSTEDFKKPFSVRFEHSIRFGVSFNDFDERYLKRIFKFPDTLTNENIFLFDSVYFNMECFKIINDTLKHFYTTDNPSGIIFVRKEETEKTK